MTNKGKVLAAVIAVAVVLAGGVALHLKGGDLMGRIFKPSTPVIPNVAVCTSQRFYNTGVGDDSTYDFESFLASVKSELAGNSGNLVCPLLFDVFSDDESVNGRVICSGNEVQIYDNSYGEAVTCSKSSPYLNVTASVYKDGGSIVNSFKSSDGKELSREEIHGSILFVDKLPVNYN